MHRPTILFEFDYDEGPVLRRLGNARTITRGLVISVTSPYHYLKHNYWIFMFPFIMVENPLRILPHILYRCPYSSDHLWLLADYLVDEVIAPPLEAYTPEFVRQPLMFVGNRVSHRAVIAAEIAQEGHPLEAARFVVQQSRQAMIIGIAKVWVYLNKYVLFRAWANVVIPPLAFFSNVYNGLIWGGFPLVSFLPYLPIDQLAIAVHLEDLTGGGLAISESPSYLPF